MAASSHMFAAAHSFLIETKCGAKILFYAFSIGNLIYQNSEIFLSLIFVRSNKQIIYFYSQMKAFPPALAQTKLLLMGLQMSKDAKWCVQDFQAFSFPLLQMRDIPTPEPLDPQHRAHLVEKTHTWAGSCSVSNSRH